MAKAAKQIVLSYTYSVVLRTKTESGNQTIDVDGNFMSVNHRGDLLILEGVSQYGDPVKLVATFCSGSWLRCLRGESKAEPQATDVS